MGGMGWPALIGGLLLAGVLLWAMLRNRQTSGRAKARTEDATSNLYDSISREEHRDKATAEADADRSRLNP